MKGPGGWYLPSHQLALYHNREAFENVVTNMLVEDHFHPGKCLTTAFFQGQVILTQLIGHNTSKPLPPILSLW